jgi:hypothetical protein
MKLRVSEKTSPLDQTSVPDLNRVLGRVWVRVRIAVPDQK